MAEIKNKWSYQFDPLNPKNVEITENGVAVFLTQSLTNAQRLCAILNSYPDMYEALNFTKRQIKELHKLKGEFGLTNAILGLIDLVLAKAECKS